MKNGNGTSLTRDAHRVIKSVRDWNILWTMANCVRGTQEPIGSEPYLVATREAVDEGRIRQLKDGRHVLTPEFFETRDTAQTAHA